MKRSLRPRPTSAVALAAVALLSRAAFAQVTPVAGFTLSKFEPAERGSRWFALDSLEFRGHGGVTLGTTFDYGYKPLVVTSTADSSKELSTIVSHQVVSHLGGSIVVYDTVRIGADLPLAVYGAGTPTQVGLSTYAPGKTGAVGDLRVALDWKFLSGERLAASVGTRVHLPTGQSDGYAGDGKWRVGPQANAAGTFGKFKSLGGGAFAWAGRAGWMYRQASQQVDRGYLGSELNVGASFGVKLLDDKLLVGPEAFTASRTGSKFGDSLTSPIDVLLGGHYRFAREWTAGAGLGKGLNAAFGEPTFRGLASIDWTPSAENDRDQDHVLDAEDACPSEAGLRTCDARSNGCPARDRDRDGVLDVEDACVDEPGVRTSDPKTNGCPAPKDADADGISDAEDACPSVPGLKSSDPRTNGCPSDRDQDGIVDAQDACVDVPGVASTDATKHGCPLPKDSDGDGIVDADDACPNQAGAANADKAKHGCTTAPAVWALVLDQVKFKTSSDEILKVSDETLQKVVEAIKALPESNRYLVEGHTDAMGDATANGTLSRRRAKSVVAWLGAHGLDAKRFTTKGWGEDKPVATNSTEEGRAQNRRVEIHIASGTSEVSVKPVEGRPSAEAKPAADAKKPEPSPAAAPAKK